ncbi:MAG: tetratricopeptide repeat protein, partial [Elusimicrobiota bacterium]
GHWHNLAYLLALQNRWPQAVAAYSQALSLDPKMAESERGLRTAWARSGLPRPPILEGLEGLRELDARLERKDYSPGTVALALRLAAQFPELPKIRFLTGSLLLAGGRPADAIAHLEWVAAREPRHVAALANLANAYLAIGRKAEAAAKFQAVRQLDAGNAAARQGLTSLGLK